MKEELWEAQQPMRVSEREKKTIIQGYNVRLETHTVYTIVLKFHCRANSSRVYICSF